jgi:ankyrin repeat protein
MRLLFLLFLAVLILPLSACTEPDRPTIGLYLAVQRGDLDQIERHLFWGSDINQPNVDGRMPLHVAAEQGRWPVAKLLIKNGADIDALDRNGHSPVYVALMAGRTQVVQHMLKMGAQIEPDELLAEAVRNGVADRDVVELMLEQGADINQLTSEGETPLILAVKKGERLLVKRLILYGADVNKPGNNGELPLAIAKTQGNDSIIRLLRQNGARESQKP